MELSKKTTILLSPRLYTLLKRLSHSTNQSIGELIRAACEKQYGLHPESASLAAAERIAELRLPVDTPYAMKRQSVPAPEDLMP